jgi:ABC-type multidrug transport system fused ATPase/permease subunit
MVNQTIDKNNHQKKKPLLKPYLQYLNEILYLLGKDRKKLKVLIVFFIGISFFDLLGLGLIGPFLSFIINTQDLNPNLQQIIDYLGIPPEKKAILVFLGIILLVTFAIKMILAISIIRYLIYFSARQQIRLRAHLMKSYQLLPYTDFMQRNSSEYIHHISDLSGRFSGVLSTGIKTLSDGITALAIFVLLAMSNFLVLALLLGLLGTMIFTYDRFFRSKMRADGIKINLASIRMVQGIHEGIEGFKEIRILGKEKYFHQMVHKASQNSSYISAHRELITMVPRFVLEMVMVLFVVSVVFLLLFMNQDLYPSIPTLGVFGVAALRLMPMANALTSSLVQLRFSRDSIARLYVDVKSLNDVEHENSVHHTLNETPFQKLSLNQISFTYPNSNQMALEKVSLEIFSGESIGLIGPSGSGKTTLVDVLLGLLEPQDGETYYNGKLLKDNLLEWRLKAAYLPQEIFLTDNTLRCNVALGESDEEIDDSRLYEALRQARLVELIEQLEDGVGTLLGEHGVRLSGGQRQRLAIARAFYHNRSILVMDEATSALDDNTEKEVIEEIKSLKGKKTLIVIAHNLNTVQHCDRIYRLDMGQIIEFGSPKQMLK